MFEIFKVGLEKVLNEILPNECVSCGRRISPFEMLCQVCKDELRGPHPLVEKHRGYELNYFSRYEGVLKKIILAYKNGRWRLYRTLGDLYLRIFEYFPPDSDSLLYIPSTFEALEVRGFDHMKLLARYVSRRSGLPLSNSLISVSQSRQMGRGSRSRMENVGRFDAVGYPGGRVALLDDVYTTGTTVRDAIFALKKRGVSEVKVYVLAKV